MPKNKRTTFQVCETKCNQCLFSDNRIVSKARMKDIIATARKNDSHFICHKHTIADRASQVMCRGWYETQPPSQMLRIAERLNVVEFVKEPAT